MLRLATFADQLSCDHPRAAPPHTAPLPLPPAGAAPVATHAGTGTKGAVSPKCATNIVGAYAARVGIARPLSQIAYHHHRR